MRLVVSDIHAEAEEPYIHIYQTAQNIYKERKILISQAWLAGFEQYKLQYQITEKVFTCTARNLEYILSDIGEGAGLPRACRLRYCVGQARCKIRGTG
jgi:integrase/recombinase XerD